MLLRYLITRQLLGNTSVMMLISSGVCATGCMHVISLAQVCSMSIPVAATCSCCLTILCTRMFTPIGAGMSVHAVFMRMLGLPLSVFSSDPRLLDVSP